MEKKGKIVYSGKRMLRKSSEKYSKSGDDSTEEMKNLLDSLDTKEVKHTSVNSMAPQQETTGNRLQGLLGSVGPAPSEHSSMNSLSNLSMLNAPHDIARPMASPVEQGMNLTNVLGNQNNMPQDMPQMHHAPQMPNAPQMPMMPHAPQMPMMPHDSQMPMMSHAPQMPMMPNMPQGMTQLPIQQMGF